jgi:hypothetical protein
VTEAAQRQPARVVALELVLVLDLEVGRGGVEEQQIHLQVEQIGDREEHRLLDRALGVGG